MGNKEKNQTKKNIIDYAKKEFLEKGYSHANLRSICRAAGVTTGAFYFSFESKEVLFRDILEPLVREFEDMVRKLTIKEIDEPDTAQENDRIIMQFQYLHREEIIIIMEKAEGSCYEDFKKRVQLVIMESFRKYFIQRIKVTLNEDIIRILVDVRIQSNLEILKGNYNMEYSLYLTDMLSRYAESGTDKLIRKIKEDANCN